MAHTLARFAKLLAIPIAGALILTAVSAASAQSSRSTSLAQEAANRSASSQKRQTASSIATGRTAVPRNAAPIALALENSPAPSSTPEPITLALVGGALAGLYGIRRHLS